MAVCAAMVGAAAATAACVCRHRMWQPGGGAEQSARALRELAEALDQDGDAGAERMARAGGVSVEAVREWHAAWKLAWKGPGR